MMEEPDEIALGEYLRVLVRHWYIVIGMAIIAMSTAAGVTMAQPPTYKATALLLVDERYIPPAVVVALLNGYEHAAGKPGANVAKTSSSTVTVERQGKFLAEAMDILNNDIERLQHEVYNSLPDYIATANQMMDVATEIGLRRKDGSMQERDTFNLNALLDRRLELLAKEAGTKSAIRVLIPPQQSPMTPKPWARTLALAGTLGIFLGCVGAFLTHWWRSEMKKGPT